MTVKEAAIRLEVSPGTVYALVSSGKLRCYRIGNGRGAIRIGEEHLSEFLKAAEPIPAPPPAPKVRLKHLRLPKAACR
jgi:excisionase family DNA binding protein